MKRASNVFGTTLAILYLLAVNAQTQSGPFDGETFKGRIAVGFDGNFNDEDDWGAFPVAVAILDAVGVTGKLVHVDYSSILSANHGTKRLDPHRRSYRDQGGGRFRCTSEARLR